MVDAVSAAITMSLLLPTFPNHALCQVQLPRFPRASSANPKPDTLIAPNTACESLSRKSQTPSRKSSLLQRLAWGKRACHYAKRQWHHRDDIDQRVHVFGEVEALTYFAPRPPSWLVQRMKTPDSFSFKFLDTAISIVILILFPPVAPQGVLPH